MTHECRFGPRCQEAVVFVAVPEGCICFPDDREQWLCAQHYLKLLQNAPGPVDVLERVDGFRLREERQ